MPIKITVTIFCTNRRKKMSAARGSYLVQPIGSDLGTQCHPLDLRVHACCDLLPLYFSGIYGDKAELVRAYNMHHSRK